VARLLSGDRLWLAGAVAEAENKKAGAFGSGLLNFLPELGRSVAVTFFYGLVDIVVFSHCHDINGIIAVQHKQFNFIRQGTKVAVFPLLLAVSAAWAGDVTGSITRPSKPDPLLDGGPTDPCAARVDYADAVDVNGKAVAPADVEARPVPLPDSIAVPIGNRPGRNPGRNNTRSRQANGANPVTLGGDSTYIAIDGRKLEPLVNPPPCAPVH
jgi:hypothetical protein